MPVRHSPIPQPLLHLTLDSNTQYTLFKKYLLTDVELKENDFPRESLHCPGKIMIADDSIFHSCTKRRRCARCKQCYRTDINYANCDVRPCFYHPKKVDVTSGAYPCCHQPYRSPGCAKGKYHVSAECDLSNVVFKKTRPGHSKFACNVFALDCEMVYTVGGLELAKVGIVDINGNTLYESFVVPEKQILDYNTEYSGVTSHDLMSNAVSFSEAQEMVLRFVTEDTILVGHGLENDLRTLRLIHGKVVDTSVLFPHERAKYKRSLKSLAMEFLVKDIQTATTGHNCIEDARTAMELVVHKINLDLLSAYSVASFPVAQSVKGLNSVDMSSPGQRSAKLNSYGLRMGNLGDSSIQTNHVSHTRNYWIDCAAEPLSYARPRAVVQGENDCNLINTHPQSEQLIVPDLNSYGVKSISLREGLKHVHRTDARVHSELVPYRHGVRDPRMVVQDENNGNLVNTSFIPKQSPTLNSFEFDGLCIPEWMQEQLEHLQQQRHRNQHMQHGSFIRRNPMDHSCVPTNDIGYRTKVPYAMQPRWIQNHCRDYEPKVFGVVHRGEWYPHIMLGAWAYVDA